MIVVGGVIPPDDVPTLLGDGRRRGVRRPAPSSPRPLSTCWRSSPRSSGHADRLMASQSDVDVAAARRGHPRRQARVASRGRSRSSSPAAPDHRAAARELLTELDLERGRPRPGRGSPVCPASASRRSSRPSAAPHRQGHQRGRARRRPVVDAHRRSVLGDKTRMAQLSAEPRRLHPSLAHGRDARRRRPRHHPGDDRARGGGYDVVLVETVGVGQSEVTVAGMVDTFLFLTIARTGDQLQGIKKGILEIADVIAVNKADGDRATEAQSAAKELAGACGWCTPPATAGCRRCSPARAWTAPTSTRSGSGSWPHRESLGEQGLAAQARRAAAGVHLGARARRAGPAAAALAGVTRHP